MLISSPPSTFEVTVDTLVVGAGGCGLVAALAAADAGLSVAVVEKSHRLEGNTTLSSGSIPAAGTRFQRAAGIADGPEQFAGDLRGRAGDHDTLHLVDRLAAISATLVEWLVDEAGVSLELIESYRHVGHSVHRLHAPPSRRGADLMADLERAVSARGIAVAFASRATAVFASDGAVVGAETTDKDGERVSIGARTLVLATNGYGADRQLLARYCPDMAGATYAGAYGSQGEAIRCGEALGARLANMGAYQGHAGLAEPHGCLATWTVIEKGGLIVDATGRRFADETVGYSAFAPLSLARRAPRFMIYDERIRAVTAAGQESFAELCAMGAAVSADTPDDLAARIGIAGDALAASVSAAGRFASGSEADHFGRKDWGLGPLDPPFCATRIEPALFHTQGGLLVDGRARVIGRDGSAIPGLYAGGGAAAGISGRTGSAGYSSGNGLLAALGLGFIAGRDCAAVLK